MAEMMNPAEGLRLRLARHSAGAISLAVVLAWVGRLHASEQVTVMDPVFVEAASPSNHGSGRSWQYLALPGFEILSRCPDAFNDAYADALERGALARQALLPEAFWGELASPMKIILYNRPPDEREALRRNPIDLAWSSDDRAGSGGEQGLVSHPVTLGDGDTFINCGNYWDTQPSNGDVGVEVDSALRLRLHTPHYPAWFIEGVVGAHGVNEHRIVRSTPTGVLLLIPGADWTASAGAQALHGGTAAAGKDSHVPPIRAFLPLGVVFAGPRDDLGDLWSAEAALLVRWGLFHSGDRQGFLDFVAEASRTPVTEAVFRKHLHMGYPEAQRRLEDYLPAAMGETLQVTIQGPSARPHDFRDATPTEVARIVGDWGRLEGRSADLMETDYKQECLEQADRLFERVVARKERDPEFLAAFGLYEIEAKDDLRARRALEAATGADVMRPRAYLELARLRLDMTLSDIQQGIGDVRAADYDDILKLLDTAREQMPALAGTYYLYARVFAHAPTQPDLNELRVLEDGMRLLPQESQLAYKAASLYAQLGYRNEARAAAERALGFAESEHDRVLLRGLLDRVNPGSHATK